MNDEQCKSILKKPCDGSASWSAIEYFLCYVGYSYGDSLTECVYEKTGNFFSGPHCLFSTLNYKVISETVLGVIYFYIKLDIATDRPSGGCPLGTYGSSTSGCGGDRCGAPNTCFCEEHCSWKRCKIDKPPQSCLSHAKREWVYIPEVKYWRTNLKGKFPIMCIQGILVL